MPSQNDWLDGALYPEGEPPKTLDTLPDRVDFVARLCSAWDFGLLPASRTVTEVRREAWREAVDACRLLTSPAYHLMRAWHALPPLPYLGAQMAYIRDDPSQEHV
jgi:hypothetical protein